MVLDNNELIMIIVIIIIIIIIIITSIIVIIHGISYENIIKLCCIVCFLGSRCYNLIKCTPPIFDYVL